MTNDEKFARLFQETAWLPRLRRVGHVDAAGFAGEAAAVRVVFTSAVPQVRLCSGVATKNMITMAVEAALRDAKEWNVGGAAIPRLF
ncbi:MAG: hypothetical protein ABIZ50_01105, partial [Solirubrobacterales bacterium]